MRDLDFKESIKEILLRGGDTDTNACILGALVGITVGEDAIDTYMKNKVMELDASKEGILRPRSLVPKYTFD